MSEEVKKKLGLKPRENTASKPDIEEKTCPTCKNSIPLDSVVCVQCGYDFRSGKNLKNIKAGAGKAFGFLITVLIFAGLVIAGVIAFKKSSKLSETVDGIVAETTAFVQETVESIKDEIDSKPDKQSDSNTGISTAEDFSDTQPGQQKITSTRETLKSEAPAQEKEIQKLEAKTPPVPAYDEQLAKEITKKFNSRYPVYESGQSIKLRTTENTTLAGRLVYVVRDYLLLELADGTRKKIVFKTLHKSSRVRCDPTFRKAYIGQIIKKKQNEKNKE